MSESKYKVVSCMSHLSLGCSIFDFHPFPQKNLLAIILSITTFNKKKKKKRDRESNDKCMLWWIKIRHSQILLGQLGRVWNPLF